MEMTVLTVMHTLFLMKKGEKHYEIYTRRHYP